MPIYMNYDGIQGGVTTQGHEKWIEVSSFQFGVGRAIGTAARGAIARENSEPSFSEITITKPMDVASVDLFQQGAFGKLDKKVNLDFTTTAQGQTTTFLKIKLKGVGISHFSHSSAGDNPTESLSLNFTKITYTYIGMDPNITGNPKTAGANLETMTLL
jgi:type VI secretion system secreted protein Hcp